MILYLDTSALVKRYVAVHLAAASLWQDAADE
jgi:hypothetical protein